MENQSYSFRSAIHGFHRGDVIAFLEQLTISHEAELRARDEKLRVLGEELLEARAELERLQAGPAPDDAEPEAAEPEGIMRSRELEAYRRAERHEREARSRAERLCAGASDAVRQTGRQIEDRRAAIGSAAEALRADFAALQAAVTDILGEMDNAGDRLAQMERDLAE